MNESDCTLICPGDSTSKCGSSDYAIKSVYGTKPQPTTDGGWSEWGNWASSGEFCGMNRTRTCTNPVPSAGGASCISDGYPRMIFPGPLPIMSHPPPDSFLNSSFNVVMNTSDSIEFDNMTGLPTNIYQTDSYLNSSYTNLMNTSEPIEFDNMTGLPTSMPFGEPEYEEPEFLPNNTESLQYQFMPWCAEDCISNLNYFKNVYLIQITFLKQSENMLDVIVNGCLTKRNI